METVIWAGYQFLVYTPKAARLVNSGGLYVFAKLTTDWIGNRSWKPLYVGQAISFSGRLTSHERWSEAENLGMNQIHLMVEQNPFSRDNIERYLIENLQPHLNVLR